MCEPIAISHTAELDALKMRRPINTINTKPLRDKALSVCDRLDGHNCNCEEILC